MEYKNKFKIVIPSYNNEQWIEPNVASIINQTYTNYDVLYINDASTDNTSNLVNELIGTYNLSNWTLVNNPINKKRGYNVTPHNKHIIEFMEDDEDILVFVDGDDWLFDENVLSKLNEYYNKLNPWMTYGGMYTYPESQPANPQNSPYNDEIHKNNAYRKDWWRASHLRTFKWWLYKQIKDKNLRYSKTNKYYFHAEDLATSYPCLEMCPKEKIGVVNFPTYAFNQTPSNRQRGAEREEMAGTELENEIRNQTPYNMVKHPLLNENFITCKILGAGVQTLGLGNQLFCIAAVLGLSLKNNAKPIFRFNKEQLPYRDNLFRNLNFSNEIYTDNLYKEPYFHYKEIDYTPGLAVDGYFQSEKYFKEYRKEILDILKISEKDKDYIINNFGDWFTSLSKKVSLHIRRGDYLLPQYSSYHPVQNIEYYNRAIEQFDKDSNFLIFSDDIEWAKDNFKGDNFYFITKNKIEGNDVMDTLDISKGGHPDYIELYMMSLCDHNIIANSSFSWWGAWLNENPNKKVIAPKKWFGPAYGDINDNDLVPETWTRL